MEEYLDPQIICRELYDDGWRTPDTYVSDQFAEITCCSAVYALIAYPPNIFDRALIAYIGMSTDLVRRLQGHETLEELRSDGAYISRWWKPIPVCDLRETERRYIHKYDPPWNIIGRRRGIKLASQ